jgi:hypothetical protein
MASNVMNVDMHSPMYDLEEDEPSRSGFLVREQAVCSVEECVENEGG